MIKDELIESEIIGKILRKPTNTIRDWIYSDVTFFVKYGVLDNKLVKINVNEVSSKSW